MQKLTYLVLLCFTVQLCCVSADDEFPRPRNTQPEADYPISAEEAMTKIKVPEGFGVTLFAKEPVVQQPICMNYDHRGRVFVTECYTYGGYPGWMNDQKDRILILEDKDQDGFAESRKVFWQKGFMMTSALPGFGGVYILNDGTLSFIADQNGDDVPDAQPQVLLDGFNNKEIIHNIVSGLMWGHDGWLYGRHGIQATSYVGKPGMPISERTPINCCIWRYHPTTQVFEMICQGTTNPWGLDYNSVGELFMTNNVIGHLWHVMHGAHYRRMYGADFNPYTYELIDQTADHYHWNNSRPLKDAQGDLVEVDKLGGGHSHCGGMIYNSGTWPDYYKDTMLMSNTHGRRINIDRLVRDHAGYAGRHEPDFFMANQPYYRGTTILQGPDGNVLVSDWVENGECHDNDGVHRTSGRIYKINYKNTPKLEPNLDLSRYSSLELAKFCVHPHDWWRRTSRQQLQARYLKKEDLKEATTELFRIYKENPATHAKLNALWSLISINATDLDWYIKELNHENEYVAGWMIKSLLNQLSELPTGSRELRAQREQKIVSALADYTKQKLSPYLRLQLASLLQKMQSPEKLGILANISSATEDIEDYKVVLMYWYAVEKDVVKNPELAYVVINSTIHRKLRQFIARRLTSELKSHPEHFTNLMKLASDHKDNDFKIDLLTGMKAGLAGWRKLPAPENWEQFSHGIKKLDNDELNKLLLETGLVFGDGQAIDELIKIARDTKLTLVDRERAAQALIDDRSPKLLTTFKELMNDPGMQSYAIRGLSEYDDPQVPKLLLNKYLYIREASIKREILSTLTSRKQFAIVLLEENSRKYIPVSDITAFDARQILNLGDNDLTETLRKVWGDIRESSEEVKKKYTLYKGKLNPDSLAKADLERGRAMFQKLCFNCHKLNGEGGNVGPDLTGANRDNIDYLLENILEPSKIVGKQYRISIVQRDDGKTFTGIILEDVNNKITLQTEKELLTMNRDEILGIKASENSLMPDGVLEKLSPEELLNLFSYLMKK